MSEEEKEKERFRTSCSRSDEYPECLIHHATYEYNLKSYRERLDEQSPRLFCSDTKADVDIWEYVDSSEDFQLASISSSFEIRGHFEGERLFDEVDPICRYLFIGAPNSRDILRISRKILNYTLTYYQVMPAFLDFIFPFGLQEQAQDFHFTGFREETHLLAAEGGLKIPELGRSGRDICMCYSLKSVERSDGDNWPWSIRQTAAYHSFDIGTRRSLWILVKGNEVIKERVQFATSPDQLSRQASLKEAWRSFASTLETHLILCDWSAESWRWYINYLEGVLQDITSRSLAVKVGRNQYSKPEEAFQMTTRRTFSTATSEKGFQQRPSTPSQIPSYRQIHALRGGPPPPPPVLPPGMGRPSLEKDRKLDEYQDFTFHDLQQVQSIEEKMNEVLLVLDSNVHVMTDLKEYYDSVVVSEEWPEELVKGCSREFTRFSKRITSITTALRMHRSRTEILLRLLSERKNLLYGILQFHSMEANKSFTTKAQKSADRMEKITVDMHKIAQKTKQETVSMKVITVVTLFFLPGTFISTLMSTDIITWQKNAAGESQRVYQSGALDLYLAITVPMMVVTFGAWRVVYEWMKWAERKEVEKAKTETKA